MAESRVGVTNSPVLEDGPKTEQNSKRLDGKREKTCVAGPTTYHVLLIHSVCKQEDARSLEKRVTEAISPKDIKVVVAGKRPFVLGAC